MQFNLHLNHNVQFHKLPPSNSNFNPTPKFTRFLLSPVKTIILNPTHFSFATSHPIISEEKYTLLHTHARKSASGAFRAAQSSTHISTYKMFCMDCVAPHIMFYSKRCQIRAKLPVFRGSKSNLQCATQKHETISNTKTSRVLFYSRMARRQYFSLLFLLLLMLLL